MTVNVPPAWSPDPFSRIQRGAVVHALSPRPPVGLTPHAVVHRHDKLKLRYYPPAAPARRTPVVLVPSMINRAYILDLEPDRSLVRALSAAGHPTYLVDWGTPGPEDAQEDVGYVVEELLHRGIDRACRHAGAERALVLGYCQGGTLAAVWAALHPERCAGLVALNAPVKFAEAGRFRDFVDPATFSVEDAIAADGLVPVEVMKPAFQLLDPVGNWTKFLSVDEAAADPRRLARVMARERWLEENVPMPGAFAREFIRACYQEDRLIAGTWTLRGRRVDLRAIVCPVLVVMCERDFISPAAACAPLAEAVGSADVESRVLACGHIGVVVGAEGPKTFYPLLDRWFRRIAP